MRSVRGVLSLTYLLLALGAVVCLVTTIVTITTTDNSVDVVGPGGQTGRLGGTVRRVDVWLCISSTVAIIASIILLLKARATRDIEWTGRINLHLGALVVLCLFFAGGALAKTINVPFMIDVFDWISVISAWVCFAIAGLGAFATHRAYRRLRAWLFPAMPPASFAPASGPLSGPPAGPPPMQSSYAPAYR